jgi:hypothetical protein
VYRKRDPAPHLKYGAINEGGLGDEKSVLLTQMVKSESLVSKDTILKHTRRMDTICRHTEETERLVCFNMVSCQRHYYKVDWVTGLT